MIAYECDESFLLLHFWQCGVEPSFSLSVLISQDLDDLDHIELPQSLEDEEGGFGGDLGDLDGEDDLEQYKD